VNAGQVGRQDEVVAQVVHHLQQPDHEEVPYALALRRTGSVSDAWKSWEIEFECSRLWIVRPGIHFAHFAENMLKLLEMHEITKKQFFPISFHLL
jgi:hypothetical protein